MWSAASNNRTTGLCNPFLSNGTVTTFPRTGRAVTSSTIQTVFSVASVQSAYKRSEFRSKLVQSGCESVSGRTYEVVSDLLLL
jgi:hypothetical protein